jgi:hypothetical protein
MTAESETERLARLALIAMHDRFDMWSVDNGFDTARVDEADKLSMYTNPATRAAFAGWCGALIDDAIQRDKRK